MTLSIRPFESGDEEAVSQVVRATMAESNTRDYPPEVLGPLMEYFSPGKVAELAEERYCIVAEESDRVIGTAALEGEHLVTFFVHPQAQGRGVGAALLAKLEEHAMDHGLPVLRVESSVTGAGFYEAQGFARTGKIVHETAGEQIEMEKALEHSRRNHD